MRIQFYTMAMNVMLCENKIHYKQMQHIKVYTYKTMSAKTEKYNSLCKEKKHPNHNRVRLLYISLL